MGKLSLLLFKKSSVELQRTIGYYAEIFSATENWDEINITYCDFILGMITNFDSKFSGIQKKIITTSLSTW